jgi:aspartate racemase
MRESAGELVEVELHGSGKQEPGGRLGIIGGAGPVATAEFYRLLTGEVRRRDDVFPDLVIHSMPLSMELIQAALEGELTAHGEAHITFLLMEALDALERAGCQQLAMPCNTFHNFLRPLLADRAMTLIDMVQVTIDQAAGRGLKRLLLLATGTSLDDNAYAAAKLHGVDVVRPTNQDAVTKLLERCVGDRLQEIDLEEVRSVILRDSSTQGVLLGCTDLTILRQHLTHITPVVDSLMCLVEACADSLARVSPLADATGSSRAKPLR